MSDKLDGGPAFPMRFDYEGNAPSEPGMSLRDWFAGMAVTQVSRHVLEKRNFDHSEENGEGCMQSSSDWMLPYGQDENQLKESLDMIAHMSYRIADAMLEAREQA